MNNPDVTRLESAPPLPTTVTPAEAELLFALKAIWPVIRREDGGRLTAPTIRLIEALLAGHLG
jgi:hypothetical protein